MATLDELELSDDDANLLSEEEITSISEIDNLPRAKQKIVRLQTDNKRLLKEANNPKPTDEKGWLAEFEKLKDKLTKKEAVLIEKEIELLETKNLSTFRQYFFASIFVLFFGVFLAAQYETILTNIPINNVTQAVLETNSFQWANETINRLFPSFVKYGDVGRKLSEEGLKAKHPVIIIPGMTSTGLEVWQDHPDCDTPLRARVWGSVSMAGTVLSDLKCWFLHMTLDPKTGRDPPNVKIRPVDSWQASQFAEVYWLWDRILENLVEVGYDANNMYMAAYDWRMSFENNQIRDRMFTKLKFRIEILVEDLGEKAVVMSHSMGSNLFLYFMQWVENETGKRNQGWVDKHIHSFASVGGAYLGMPKTFSALTSGEMKDTSQLGGMLNEMMEAWQLSSRQQRVNIFRSWQSLRTLLPMGGDALWAPGEDGKDFEMFKNMAVFNEECNKIGFGKTVPASLVASFLKSTIPTESGDFWIPDTYSQNPTNEDSANWYNPLKTPLPSASKMSIYSFYGTGKQTERSYRYKCNSTAEEFPYSINTNYNENEWVNGVRFSDGDGTVPLVSLGYLSAKQWRVKSHNPSGMKIVTREIVHEPHPFFPRGGDFTGDHVDVLGNIKLVEDLTRISCGQELPDFFHSKIKDISEVIYKNLEKTTEKEKSTETKKGNNDAKTKIEKEKTTENKKGNNGAKTNIEEKQSKPKKGNNGAKTTKMKKEKK